jgi:GNAT superfamily N-acetyltransferase
VIRLATKYDIPQIVRIDQTAVSDGELVGYGPPADKRVLADEDRLRAVWVGNSVGGLLVYVFEEEGCILGFTQIRVDPNAVELDDITVAPEHKRKGIGTKMVEFVENLAINLGKQYVTLGTTRNTKTGIPWNSYSFWLNLGYVVEDEIETEEGRVYGFTEIRFRKKVLI